MGWIYRPRVLLKDANGVPLLDANGQKLYRFTTKNWTIRYTDVNGIRHDEATGQSSRTEAARRLRSREGATADGELPAQPQTITWEQGVALIQHHYAIKQRRSWSHVQGRITNYLAPVFGGTYLATITAEALSAYSLQRLAEGAAGPTINRELAIVRRILRLAVKARRLTSRPEVDMHAEATPRQGFFERETFERVRHRMPPHLRPILTVAYITGWRIKSEVHRLTFDLLDLPGGELRLSPDMTKNGKGRIFPLDALPELRQCLEAQVASAEAVQRRTHTIVRDIFHNPDGRQIGRRSGIHGFYAAWHVACEAEGLTKIPHDFRRTAVRNLVRAGVPESIAMKLTGHLTRAIFDKYDIVAGRDLRWATELLHTYQERERKAMPRTSPKVRPIKGGQ